MWSLIFLVSSNQLGKFFLVIFFIRAFTLTSTLDHYSYPKYTFVSWFYVLSDPIRNGSACWRRMLAESPGWWGGRDKHIQSFLFWATVLATVPLKKERLRAKGGTKLTSLIEWSVLLFWSCLFWRSRQSKYIWNSSGVLKLNV